MSKFAYLQDYNQAATKIQSSWKGRQIRLKGKTKSTGTSADELKATETDFEMLQLVSQQLAKFRLTFDGTFRVWDSTMSGKIQTSQFIQQIEWFGVKLTEEAKTMLMLIFDEDSTNEITYEDLIDIWDAYGIGFPASMSRNFTSVSKRALIAFVETLNNKWVSAEQVFNLHNRDVISTEDFTYFIEENLKFKLKKRELFALTLLFSTNKTKLIFKDEFLSLIDKGQKLVDKLSKTLSNNRRDSFDLYHNKFSRSWEEFNLGEHDYINKMKNRDKNPRHWDPRNRRAEIIVIQLAVSEIEYTTNVFLVEWFNHIKKCSIIVPQRLIKILKILYFDKRISQEKIIELKKAIMGEKKTEIKFKELYSAILKLSSNKWKAHKYFQIFEKILINSIQNNTNFDSSVDKSFIK